MTYVPNGLADRIDWVVRTYRKRPVVAYETLRVIASAIGLDHVTRTFGRATLLRRGSWWAPTVTVDAEAEATADETVEVTPELVAQLHAEMDFEPDTRSDVDPIIPWVAASIARLVREHERAVSQYLWLEERESVGRRLPGLPPPWGTASLERSAELKQAYADVEDTEGRLNRSLYVLLHRGAAIAMWAQEERPNLTSMTVPEVNDAVKAWGDARKLKREVPQGKVIYEWPDGWTIQWLGSEHLEAEGDVMQHCVGGYCEQVRYGDVVIYSLRDPRGRPHVTIEYNEADDDFVQVMGKQNEPPAPKYAARVVEWLEAEYPHHIDLQAALGRTDFRGVRLTGIRLSDGLFVGCNFDEADFGPDPRGFPSEFGTRVRFERCSFRRASFVDARVNATFWSCDFTGADLRGEMWMPFLGGQNIFTDAVTR